MIFSHSTFSITKVNKQYNMNPGEGGTTRVKRVERHGICLRKPRSQHKGEGERALTNVLSRREVEMRVPFEASSARWRKATKHGSEDPLSNSGAQHRATSPRTNEGMRKLLEESELTIH